MPDDNATLESDGESTWYWRNCRGIQLTVVLVLLPWQWHCRFERQDYTDYTQGTWGLQFGPVCLLLNADIGDCSTGDWRARFALSEYEAWERTCKYYAKRRRQRKGL